MAAPPDLTAGGVPNEDPAITINLGPTGARGWVYHVRTDTSESRQILVTQVEPGSPADGLLDPDDVILGASGDGTTPTPFSSDARKSLGLAIGEAEARSPATLQLLCWRTGNTSTVTLTLETMGAYTATAPYNCPKSSKILQDGLRYVYDHEDAGRYSFGALALLADGDPTYQARAQTEARALVPSQATMDQMMSDERDASSMITWQRGHTLIFLAEYYLATGDAEVLPAIEAYAVNIAKNHSLFGTVGHIFAEKNRDGSHNGPMGGVYGPVNTPGLFCFLGVLLAKECGLTNPEIDPAIERSSRFFAYYTGKGAIPYGEHEPYSERHENNGKCGLTALAFMLQDHRVDEGRFFAKMSTASATEREEGHTGSFFNYVWAPLGAAAGGEEAAAAHFSRISWMLDLNRCWNGRFQYDCLNGEGPNSGSDYHSFRMSTAALLTYALPLRRLHMTGKGHDSSRWLTTADVAEAIAADDYDADSRSDSELITDLGNWSPKVRREAAIELGTRSIGASELSQITALANETGGDSRAGACFALGQIGEPSSAEVLAALLTDSDNYVRYMAAESLRYLPTSAKLGQVDSILAAAASTSQPLYPMVEEDPLHFAHGKVAVLLFYHGNAYGPKGVIWGSGVDGVNRDLLYPAIRAIAATPVGFCRSTLNMTYQNLTYDDVLAVAGAMLDSITDRSPSDKMFSGGVREGGVKTLQKFGIAEGVPACMLYAADEVGGRRRTPLELLGTFGGGVHTVEPDPGAVPFLESYLSDSETAATAQASLDAIAADTNPTPLTALKSILSATADDSILTLPASSTMLRVDAHDYAQGDSVFEWEKLSGPGPVSFSRNGNAAAATSLLSFAGTVGTYQFKVTMSDSRALTEAYATVTVELVAGEADMTPPEPDPMTWAAVPAPVSDTEITMTAATADDPSGVEYYFTCTVGGGNDSGWQESPTYTDIGLAPGTEYSYTVAARDKSSKQNATAPSTVASATTNGTAPPLKIFILAGQSNMEGHGEMAPVGTEGTLEYLCATHPGTYGHLKNGVDWATRADAWIWYKRGGTTLLKGGLSAGYGAYDHTIGPELQFGHEMGNAYGERILIVKTAWGGKSLYTDFRPPSSGWSVDPPAGAGDQGYYYQEMLNDVNHVLANLATYFPDYDPAAGYELAGFGWHQGWNDRVNQPAVDEYEVNMANFINDVRADLGVTNLPFVIATTGMGGWEETHPRALSLMAAQLAMADVGKYPAFAGNVAVVDTRDFWRDPAESPSTTQGYHWNRNAETYFLIGQAMALKLQSLGAGADTAAPTPNPARFAMAPTADSDTAISMTAAAGSDPSGPVEYLFTETSGNAGGTSSGWQTSMTYIDTGLLPETVYTYTVTMRDSLGNSGTESAEASASTISYLDIFPPTPNPATFSAAPTTSSATSITMTATTGSDFSGPVEYLFSETSGNAGGTSSGWQTSPTYTDTGLSPRTVYTYTVTLRDGLGNVGTASAPISAMATDTDIFSVNFYAYGSMDQADYDAVTLEVDESAGVGSWHATGWENYSIPWGLSSPANPVTITSVLASEATFTLNNVRNGAPYAWSSPHTSLPGDGNADLMDGHANGTEDPGDQSKIFDMTVSDIPFSTYDVIIYMGANQAQFGDGTAKIVFNGGPEQDFRLTSGEFAAFVEITDSVTPGNYIVFEGVTGSSFTVQVWGNGFNHIAPTGFQFGPAPDIDPPTPNPASFSTLPHAVSMSAISMTATTASDVSGPVEYFFNCTSGGGHDSNWQTSPTYTDTGLTPGTEYTYTVTARDRSGYQNTTAPSAEASAFTTGAPPTVTVPDVVGLTQVDAESAIALVELTVGNVTTATSTTVPAGSVISQNPAGGSSAPAGSPVDLVVSLGPPPPPNLAHARVNGVTNTSWAGVDLGIAYNSPVIVATPIYPDTTLPPVVTRIRNVSGSSFDLKLDRVDGLTDPVSIDVSVVAVEEGVYTQAEHGVTMEAAAFTSTVTGGNGNWVAESRGFQNSYTAPVVVGQVMSANDANWSVFWSMGSSVDNPVDAANLNVGKHVAEDPNQTRADETIGYIVIESGNGEINGVAYEAGLGADTVQGFGNSSAPYTYSLSGSIAGPSSAAASISGMDGNNGAWAVLSGATPITSTTLGLHALEDLLGDTEQSHTTTQVAYVVLGDAPPGDTDPPALVGIGDDQNGAPVAAGDLVVYTLTFSEDMDEATVEAADFANAGSSAITIGAITETSPGVFAVEVIPTTGGTLQFQILAGAVLTDAAGNALDTSFAILDDSTVTVNAAQVTVPNVVGMPQATAEGEIGAARLTVGTVTSQSNPTVPAGEVFSQTPASGTTVDEGTAVDLVVSTGPAADMTTHTASGGSHNNDTWNNPANWDNGVPAGTVNAVIGSGNHASVNSSASGTSTPAYTGTLTLEANSTLELGNGSTAGDLNALGTGTWTLNTGSEIRLRYPVNSLHPNNIVLAGDAKIAIGQSTSAHWEERSLTGSISGSGLLTIHSTNGNVLHLQGNNTWSGGLLAGGSESENKKESIEAEAPGSLGTGDVTINDGVTLIIDAADAMDDGATLYLSGNPRSDFSQKLGMNADDIISALYIDGVQQPAGFYDNSKTWLSGNGTLIVLQSPGTGDQMLVAVTDPGDEAADVVVPGVLTAIFTKPVVLDSGSITVRNLTDSIDTVIPVGDPRLSVSGHVLTIDPQSDLRWGKSYSVRIDATAIESDTGIDFAGIADDTTWNFTTLPGDPLLLALQALQDHMNGLIILTAAEVAGNRTTIVDGRERLDDSAVTIGAAFETVAAYDAVFGSLDVDFDRQNPVPDENSVSDQLNWTIFELMQAILDVTYTADVLAAHEALIDGFKFGCSSHFPGAADPPADPLNVHTAVISASFEDTFGRDTQHWEWPARKPTGCYLAPGTIVTVTVPPALVGQEYQIRVGAHSWDHEAKNRRWIKRLSRATILYDINTVDTKVASPYGGGVYIEVPPGASAGIVEVDVTGAIRAPYFSAKSFHTTTLEEWLTTERNHLAPWADFQSDKYMMQVPTDWIYALDDPVGLMADWDAAIDAMNDLMGFPHIRGKETMYCQVDVILRAAVHAPGYPAINQTYDPAGDYGGYAGSYLVRGPQSGAHTEIHEQGHAYFFPKFGGEKESTVNFPYVAVLQRKFGIDLDEAHAKGCGMGANRTIDKTAIGWMCSFNFSPREVEMHEAEKAYQLKGHARFSDIVRLFGWDGLDLFWYSMMLDEENGDPVPSSDDDKLIRLCQTVGADLRPLFHFWGTHPTDPVAVQAAIDAEGLTPSPQIYRLLHHYKSILPADNAEFQAYCLDWYGRQPNPNGTWTESEHGRQWDSTPWYEENNDIENRPNGEIYVEATAAAIQVSVQKIIDLYFPSGDPAPGFNPIPNPDPMQFARPPAPGDANTVTMTSMAATGLNGPMEYFFQNTTTGGNSGWITANTWVSTGLPSGSVYSFRVKARNSLLNETAWSAEMSSIPGGGDLPPTLAPKDIVDDQGGGPVTRLDLITYTLTFSHDMDAATVDATDFTNSGTSAVTIGDVAETSPGVFTVQVTPGTVGTLQLTVAAGAFLANVAGDPLDTTNPIADNTTLTISSILVTVPDVTGLAQAVAEADIAAAHLAVGAVTGQHDALVPAGDVISQTPAGDTSAAEGSTVDLVVSLGPENRTVTFQPGGHGALDGGTPDVTHMVDDGSACPAAPTVIPVEGYEFTGWDPVLPVTITADFSTTAQYELRSYTVTFELGEHGTRTGGGELTQSVEHGSAATAPAFDVADGWRFTGWDAAFDSITGPLTVTAHYEQITYMLTYTAGENGSVDGASPQTVVHGQNGTGVEAVPATGHHFVQWSDGVTANPRTDTNVTASVTVTAQFAIDRHAVTFQPGDHGALAGGTPDVAHSVGHGGPCPVPPDVTPSTGYDFTGWDPVLPANITADFSTTAQYELRSYTVTFNLADHGTRTGGGELTQSVEHGSAATAPAFDVADGWRFTGWDVAFDTVTGPLTVTAHYEQITYTLTYTAGENGTIVGTSPQTVVRWQNGSAVEAVPATDYHFVQWSDGVTANPRTDTNVTASVTVTAQFAIDRHAVTFQPGGHGVLAGGIPDVSHSVEHGGPCPAPPDVTPSTGYDFTGWDPVLPANITADFSTTAQYELRSYTVTFNLADHGTRTGGGELTQSVGHGAAALQPILSVEQGWRFTGWDVAFDSVTGPLTVTAHYEQITYMLTYTAGENGSVDGASPQTVAHGQNGTVVEAVPATGHHFVQWSDGGTANPRQDLGVTADISVTAVFAVDRHTVTFQPGGHGALDGGTPDVTHMVDYGSACPAAPTVMPLEGYELTGWDPVLPVTITAEFATTAKYQLKRYTVTFELGDHGIWTGGGELTQSVDHGSAATAPAFDVTDGWRFTGWDVAFDTVTGPLTVTAHYEQITYTLTYAAGDNGSVDGASPQTVAHGQSGTVVEAVPATGHHFVQWSDGGTANPRQDLGVTADISVTAVFAVDRHTVTFQPGGHGALDGGTPDVTHMVDYGSACPAAPTVIPVEGYEFTGWDPVLPVTITAEFATTAKYQLKRYTVTFELGDHGTWTGGGELTQSVDHGSAATAPAFDVADGWRFTGWDAAFDTVTGPLTVTAHYERITYTLTYAAGENGSVDGVSPQTVAHGQSGTVVEAVPATGHHFVQWSDGGTANPRQDLGVTADISVTAVFAVDRHTVTFQPGGHGALDGGTPDVTHMVDYGSACPAAPTVIPVEGHEFTGWDPVLPVTITAEFATTAQYQLKRYTVTFELGDHGTWTGGGELTQSVDHGSAATAPAFDVTDGWRFTGWDVAFDTVTGPLTVTAHYEQITYTLTYAAGDNGSVDGASPQTVAHGQSGTVVEAVPATGHHFVQWSDGGTANPRQDLGVTADISVTAVFAVDRHTVTFQPGGHGALGGGTPDVTHMVEHASACPAAPTVIPVEGYEFTVWDPVLPVTITAEFATTAQYQLKRYTVTFELGDHGTWTGGGELTQSVEHGSAATAPAFDVTDGWRFTSWDVAFDTVTGPLTANAVYAQYHSLTVTGGTGPVTAYAGQQVAIFADAPLERRTFSRWMGDTAGLADGGSADTTLTMPDGDVSLTAVYAFEKELVPGWNAVSLPFEPLDNDIARSLHPLTRGRALSFDAWVFDGTLFHTTLTLDSCQAAWIRTSVAAILKFESIETTIPPLDLNPGWQFVGPGNTTNLSALRQPSMQGWQCVRNRAFRKADTLDPGRAYWIWVAPQP